MELTPADWVNASLTEVLLAREWPPLYVAARLGCVAAQLPGTPRALQELILPGQGEA